MVNIQINLPEKIHKRLKIAKEGNDYVTLQDTIIKILELFFNEYKEKEIPIFR